MLPDPDVRRRSDLVRQIAGRLRALDLSAVERLTGDDTWTGPVAATFALRVAAHRRALDDCATALVARARRWDSIG